MDRRTPEETDVGLDSPQGPNLVFAHAFHQIYDGASHDNGVGPGRNQLLDMFWLRNSEPDCQRNLAGGQAPSELYSLDCGSSSYGVRRHWDRQIFTRYCSSFGE